MSKYKKRLRLHRASVEKVYNRFLDDGMREGGPIALGFLEVWAHCKEKGLEPVDPNTLSPWGQYAAKQLARYKHFGVIS